MGLGGALDESGRYEEAVDVYEKAIAVFNGGYADAYGSIAISLQSLGRKAEAEAAFERAAALDARYAQPEKLVQAIYWSGVDAAQARGHCFETQTPAIKITALRSLLTGSSRYKSRSPHPR